MTPNEKSSLPVFSYSRAGECASLLTWETIFDAIEDGVCVQSLDSRIVCAKCDREDGCGKEVVIEVEDNSRGIPEEDLSRIFSPFFSTNPNGAGLGLPAVRRVARAHGGRVEAASTPGRGSTFTIRLPPESGKQL